MKTSTVRHGVSHCSSSIGCVSTSACAEPAVVSCMQGRWALLWSSPQSDFARTQRRFGPIPTSSVQLIGQAGGIDDDRAANLIQIAGGAHKWSMVSAQLLDSSYAEAAIKWLPPQLPCPAFQG